jgi:exosome complex component CSL4
MSEFLSFFYNIVFISTQDQRGAQQDLELGLGNYIMSNKSVIKEKLVVPGSKIGVIEEFNAGNGTYEVDGVIYSQLIGDARADTKYRTVSIRPKISPIYPTEGREIIGVVEVVQEKLAVINIMKIGDSALSKPFTGFLHISAASPRYAKNMREICKPMDRIRAKIINISGGFIRLMTSDHNLGVLKTFCSNCGYQLSLKRTVLKCERCKNIEKRKLALD